MAVKHGKESKEEWIKSAVTQRDHMERKVLKYGQYKKKIEKEIGNLPKNEELSGRKAHTNTRKLNSNVQTITDAFLDQERVNVCEHTVQK